MPTLSRRKVLRDLGMLSAAGAFTIPAMSRTGAWGVQSGALPTPDPNDLYLIFTGSWLLNFEPSAKQIRLVTSHFDEHTYDCNLNPGPTVAPNPITINPNLTHKIIVDGSYSPPNTPHDLVAGMIGSSQGFIFQNNVTLDTSKTSRLRTVIVPIPSSIQPAAILSGVNASVDKSTSQIPSIESWPTAYAFVYSGKWGAANLVIEETGKQLLNLQSGSRTHVQFRVCPTATCKPPGPCTGVIDCKVLKAQEDHSKMVFESLLTMLNFPDGTFEPTISFPVCASSNSYLKVDLGPDNNITRYEVGMPEPPKNGGLCMTYANLHNCAASGLIAGA